MLQQMIQLVNFCGGHKNTKTQRVESLNKGSISAKYEMFTFDTIVKQFLFARTLYLRKFVG